LLTVSTNYNTAVCQFLISLLLLLLDFLLFLFHYIAENDKEIEAITSSKQEDEAATIATPPTAIETKYSAFHCLCFFRFLSLQPSTNTFRRVNING
jgi:hypothetical protein